MLGNLFLGDFHAHDTDFGQVQKESVQDGIELAHLVMDRAEGILHKSRHFFVTGFLIVEYFFQRKAGVTRRWYLLGFH